jgi:putative transposase
MQQIESLDYGNIYHVYNSAVQGNELFRDRHDYERFLSECDRYIDVVAETYAWCLMGNHFHLMIRVLAEKDIKPFSKLNDNHQLKSFLPAPGLLNRPLSKQPPSDPSGDDGVAADGVAADGVGSRKPKPSTQFSHLFNSYAQYYNTRYHRRGTLFQRPFKRKLVDDEDYLKQLVIYIHCNPVHHGFVGHPEKYPWSSYHGFITDIPSKIRKGKVLDWFGGESGFIQAHLSKQEIKNLEEWLE